MNVCSVTVLTVVLISTINSIRGEITTTTSPEPLRYLRQSTLTCNIGKITDTVRWVYNKETRFSCSPPYDAGGCTINNPAVVGDPTYDVNTTAGTIGVSLKMKESENDGPWTCFHGAMSKQINLNPTDSPYINAAVSIDSTRLDVGDKLQITCDVSHTDSQRINVEVRSTRRGSLFTVNNTLDTTFPVALIVKCSDDYDTFKCIADGGGVNSFDLSFSPLKVNCRKTLITEKTVFVMNATIGNSVTFSPVMRGSLHQLSSDFDIKWYRLRSQSWENQMLTLPGYRVKQDNNNIFGLKITNVHHQDAGQYKLTWTESGSTATNEATFTLQIVDEPITKEAKCLENGANGMFNINRFGMISIIILTLVYYGRN
ncbi:uncharacterized protein LOC126825073 [Patella vulgata]|uniref:uncharacterized protein LOC126825073 n=1 Tax=Patella vulgata TaxID=6465 RepID=UPI0024A952A4|nr:uncharacterized protein LOC126825073 [Patella vulgata]